MSTIIMYWDRINPLGEPVAGIEILSNQAVDIPPNACGFRLGLSNHNWHEAWYFARHGNAGLVFSHNGIAYSSAFTGAPSPDAISARGPVHGCSSGSYEFNTPLGAFGIAGDAPVVAGAGSFIADFTHEGDIEWLDSAGKPIKKSDGGKPPKGAKLPKEFFEKPPEVKGCFRDFEGKLHCPEEADSAAMAKGPALAAFARSAPPTAMFMLASARSGIIPQFQAIAAPAAGTAQGARGKVEVVCPAELTLTATFFKEQSMDPATVQYRFRFAHGPVSTVFSAAVDKDGANSVAHSVPIPLPPPLGGNGGGGSVPPGPGGLSIFVKPEEPPFPSGSTVQPIEPNFTVEALPPNEHKSSVRVEVVNAFDGVVASSWVTYHLVCASAPAGPTLKRGAKGAAVTALQAALNRWLEGQQMTLLQVDGIFGPRTEAAVRAFQKAQGLGVDGIAGPRTWKELRGV